MLFKGNLEFVINASDNVDFHPIYFVTINVKNNKYTIRKTINTKEQFGTRGN